MEIAFLIPITSLDYCVANRSKTCIKKSKEKNTSHPLAQGRRRLVFFCQKGINYAILTLIARILLLFFGSCSTS